jgi:hypothetical protein
MCQKHLQTYKENSEALFKLQMSTRIDTLDLLFITQIIRHT